MLTFAQFLLEAEGKGGQYAAYRFLSTKGIQKYIDRNQIPNPIPTEKLHVTLLYSRKPMPGYKPLGLIAEPIKVMVEGFDVWDTQDGKKALVARLDAPKVVARHHELMKKYGGTFDYDEYRPHFTMSYDVGPDFDKDRLPPFQHDLYLNREYGEELNTNWKDNDKADRSSE
jgi:hypothetical protein